MRTSLCALERQKGRTCVPGVCNYGYAPLSQIFSYPGSRKLWFYRPAMFKMSGSAAADLDHLHFYGNEYPIFPEHYVQLIVARAFFSGSTSQMWSCQFYIYHEHELHASRIVNIEWYKKQKKNKQTGKCCPPHAMFLVVLSLSLFCLSLFLHSFLICIAMKLLGMIVHYAPYVVICMCITWANSNKLET